MFEVPANMSVFDHRELNRMRKDAENPLLSKPSASAPGRYSPEVVLMLISTHHLARSRTLSDPPSSDGLRCIRLPLTMLLLSGVQP